MPTHVIRAWLPDRPGALGAVASRIGAVRGDVIGIDILERSGGRALDELMVRLPSADLVPLLIEEVAQVDGVVVEDVRLLPGPALDPRLDGLEAAAALVEQRGSDALLSTLVRQARWLMDADWAMVVDGDGGLRASAGTSWETVQADRLGAGLGSVDGNGVGTVVSGLAPDSQRDTARAHLTSSGLRVVLGRTGRPLRERERSCLSHLARIADRRWCELDAVQSLG